MIVLAVDIGNTNVKLGLFDADRLLKSWRVETRAQQTDDDVAVLVSNLLALDGRDPADIGAAAIVSVVPPLTGSFEAFARRRLGVMPLMADATTLAPLMQMALDRPGDVGPDRLVNAFAAHAIHGGPAIVLDAGTATTFDALAADGTFLGGAIAPGPRAALDALAASTARLPRVELRRPPHAIGRSTAAAMQSGAVNGYIGLVSGLLTAIRAELLEQSPASSRVTVVATGGHARDTWLADIPGIDTVEPDLTLIGLNMAFATLGRRTAEPAR
ncbi:MAG: type III pantothenate kinase [Candidatus Limnocylindria bacterium]